MAEPETTQTEGPAAEDAPDAPFDWRPLVVLALAQFIMVLDQAVMNVSISQLVEDFDTEVTAIQAVITLYALTMAAFMITGGKVGDRIGRRRAFRIGLIVYAVGSATTAVAPTLGILALGWSLLEGVGAALVLPALAALIGSTYAGKQRALAYGVIGGVAGAGIAVGPILGGWITTEFTWRLVFAGEVVIVIVILALLGWIEDAPGPDRPPHIDGVGAALSASGLALVVLAALQSSSWGFLEPRNSPVEPLGFALTPFVLAGGLGLLWAFAAWQRRRVERHEDPLVDMALFRVPPLRSGLITLTGQQIILLGIFFTLPLYLQVVQGLDALETGIRLLPVSVTMLVTSMGAPVLNRFASPRTIVRTGLLVLVLAALFLLETIEPELNDASFAIAMATMGIGMGLMASQLGNVVQSAVGDDQRSEVGGLQYTAQNLGASLGTALVGAVLLASLTTTFGRTLADDERISEEVSSEVTTELEAGVPFITTDQARTALDDAGVSADETDALIESYSESQLRALRVSILFVAALALGALAFTGPLPSGGSRRQSVGDPTPVS